MKNRALCFSISRKENQTKYFSKGGDIINITISPFHLLCILKEYGEGTDLFQPDLELKNEYYFLANAIVFKDVEHLVFTIEPDDACNSCVFLKNDICIDEIKENNIQINKNIYYTDINRFLFKIFNIQKENLYDFNNIMMQIRKKMSVEIIDRCWSFNSEEESKIIFECIQKGINKLLSK